MLSAQERFNDRRRQYSRVLSPPYQPKLSIGVPKEFPGAPRSYELVTGQYLDHGRYRGRGTLGPESVDMNCPFLLLSANRNYGPKNTYV